MGNTKRIDYNWSEFHLYSDTKLEARSCVRDSLYFTRDFALGIEPKNIEVSDNVTVIGEIV